ncbi:spindle and kinetochore-associated protein 2 isoform X2 [Octopus bimaculoides]|uniref:Protein FAM33A n=1 Tax=Octopus bimaculoides TaxID=37653 RepID=A0A0L8IFC1_OCTBM|nr:spindle and kinetochore-associated protein 2 isoform X2 [Octopus bimaculoides]|eukprot:XP_014769960.1 PREDICTED: spindle and kinetochore-associated protein 2-like [Octopus bimaculoides]
MAGEIEKSVEFLEALFQKSESDLNHIERKLEFEFQDGLSKEENPVRLMKKVAAIKKEFLEVVEETKKLQDAQKEITDNFREQLSVLMQLREHIDCKISNPKREPSVEVQALEQLLGLPICAQVTKSEPDPVNTIEESPPECETELKPAKKPKKNPPKTATTEVDMKEFLTGVEETNLSPASKRKDTDEFIPLTVEEFEKVSTLVRRNIKLGDVNACYHALWQHFKVEKNTQALSPKDMYNMGMRVSGASGEAKLKILRALKLLHLSAKGHAKLL